MNQVKKLWPTDSYAYQEERALELLHLKSYRIEDAILSILYDREELIQLIKIHERQKLDASTAKL